jgi:hypothetical protein
MVVAKPGNDARHGSLSGLEDALLPMANGVNVHTKQLCQVGLKEVLLETFVLQVLPDGLGFDRDGLFAHSAAGIWTT